MKKLLFLDFDGVLHPATGPQSETLIHAAALSECLQPYECSIVISSHWRFLHSREELLAMLPEELSRRVIGLTGPIKSGKLSRHQEIRAYLAQKIAGACTWRALDDAHWEFPHGLIELLACDGNTGVQEAELNVLEAWLQT